MNRSTRVFHTFYASHRGIVALFVAVLATSGCGTREKPKLPVFPVSGRILVDGVAPVRAEIRMKPKIPFEDPMKRSVEPYAFVQEDGTFEIGTYSCDDGAPAGEYTLTMVWPIITVEGGEDVIGADRLRGRFSNPESSIATFEVEESENEIPLIELKFKSTSP